MKSTVFKYQFSIFTNILLTMMLITGCDGMKTELDIDMSAFPPKLCVTAILDGASGTFSIVITEGRALADYKKPRLDGQKVIVNGEIHLYEDDREILSKIGEFDITSSRSGTYLDMSTGGMIWSYDGYRFETPVVTNPGSTYRLVVKTDKHETITSISTMPLLPDISATIDTTVLLKKQGTKEYSSLQGWYSSGHGGEFYFWPLSLQWGERPAGRNYYALEVHDEKTLIEGVPNEWSREGRSNIGVHVSDLSKLQDNPEVELFESQELDLDVTSRYYELYKFQILLMSDIGFTNENASLPMFMPTMFYNRDWDQYYPPGVTRSVFNHKLTLRVRHITEETFKYYRSLALQSMGIDFFTEPVNIISNIENGYGGFIVYSAVEIQLLEYKTYEYRGVYW